MKRIVLNAAGVFVLLAALFLGPVNSEVHAATQGLNCQGSGNITLELDPGHGYDTSTKTGDTGAVNTTYNLFKYNLTWDIANRTRAILIGIKNADGTDKYKVCFTKASEGANPSNT